MRAMVLNDDVAVVQGRDGLFLVNRHDRYIGRAIERYGEYNGIEGSALTSLVQSNDIVIEVGANIGSHTVGLAKKTGPRGKVFAFEPQRACYALLQSQIALNQLGNVYAFNEGLGTDDATLWLPPVDYSRQGNFGGVSLVASAGENHEAVKVRRLDDVCGDLPSVALIKIDVEGMEREVIAGGIQLITRTKPILYVENDRFDKHSALISLIQKLGYRLWWHFPPLFSPRNFFGVKENEYGGTVSINMLCVHSAQPVPQHSMAEIKSPDDPHPLAPK